jgi:transcriptional regulator with XRE-family HTH domain
LNHAYPCLTTHESCFIPDSPPVTAVITAAQLKAARALLGMDQRALAQAAGLSLPTVQRMEASKGTVRGTVDSLVKLVVALEAAGVELIAEGAPSAAGGRGVRLRA